MVDETTVAESAPLTEDEYKAALDELAEYERRIAESDRLAQGDSMKTAAILDRLYRDQRWVEERNLERAATAKTAAGGRPVDPTSRSQFSTWVRGRYNQIDPRRTYQLLDAYTITGSFLNTVQRTPTAEAQVRPLKRLTKKAHGSGKRIPEVWDIAVKLAGGGQPTKDDVRQAITEWEQTHLDTGAKRREQYADKAERDRGKAQAAVEALFADHDDQQVQRFHDWYVAFVKARST